MGFIKYSIISRGNSGVCSKCGSETDDLLNVEISDESRVKRMALCKDCAKSLYYMVKKKNDALNKPEKPRSAMPDNNIYSSNIPNPHPANAATSERASYSQPDLNYGVSPVEPKNTGKKKVRPLPIIIASVALIFAIIVTAVVAPQIVKSAQLKRNETVTYDNNRGSYSDDTPAVIETTKTSAKIFESKKYTFKSHRLNVNSYQLDDGYFTFSDGLAWVYAEPENEWNQEERFVINTEGNVIYHLDSERFERGNYNDYIKVTPFKNGLSCITSGYHDVPDPGFLIIDKTGKEVYNDSGDEYTFCGQADDGTFFFSKHVANYSDNYYHLCYMDSNLNMVETSIEYSATSRPIIKLGEEVYNIYNTFINIKNSSIFKMDGMSRRPFFDSAQVFEGKVFFRFDNGEWDYYRCQLDDLYNQILQATDENDLGQKIMNISENISISDSEGRKGLCLSKFHNGCWFGSIGKYLIGEENDGRTYHYFDFKGNILVNFDTLKTSVNKILEMSAELVGDTSQELSFRLKGADGKTYYTAYNSQGERMYEPVQKDFNSINSKNDSFKGYIFLSYPQDKYIIDRNGNQIKIGDNFSYLKESDYYLGECISLNQGWIFFKGEFGKIDGSKTIKSITVNYDSSGNIIYG